MAGLTGFTVRGLHGYRDISASFRDNRAILVGDNGIGKSTFLQALFYVLSGKPQRLIEIDFRDITISFGKARYSFTKREVENLIRFDYDEIRSEMSSAVFNRLTRVYNDILEKNNKHIGEVEPSELSRESGAPLSLSRRFVYNFEAINSNTSDNNLSKILKEIKERIDVDVLYFPTYRKVETDLSTLLRGAPNEIIERAKRFIDNKEDGEILGFGMEDVKELISSKTNELSRDFNESVTKLMSGFLVKVINGEHRSNISENTIDEKELSAVLQRTGSDIIPLKTRQKIAELVIKGSSVIEEDDAIVLYFVSEMTTLYRNQTKKEGGINDFVKKCNRYFIGKRIEFNTLAFSVSIIGDKLGTRSAPVGIDWQNLSSGEKQIASIFARLHLNDKKYIVLIDEPELSLSLEWQRMLLPDISESNNCSGLIAVTHSPFVFENSLDEYAQDFKISRTRVNINE